MEFRYSVLIMLFAAFVYQSCNKKILRLYPQESIAVFKIDSTKFTYYNEYSFGFQSGKKARIIVGKGDPNNDLLKKTLEEFTIDKYDLCDVREFKFNNGDTLKGDDTESTIYKDGLLVIDLTNHAEVPYFILCQ